ncbi:Outer membrane protein assembly factor BamB, contains PQQ-like beta-propeller repeat [Paenibacillus algorifonticola]|uniref:Outer membrane protein assembly factor BamB, contains PQQ-like beta-propeller repeat n=1 Tax=Paenibacillus algorifonticola TaxID=684063 RepID=A0A1I2AC96_9BACL|nr:hypothetical protein [Paenibacillus algorifonticola]SFE41516.1 Outer membrane protein assembly factor BamB, contains PQQ-like beta-propeller repeat [Paenibacillus algorifonticola]
MKQSIAVLLVSCLLFLSSSASVSAEKWSKLPTPQWTQGTGSEYLEVKRDIHVLPNKKTVYMHMQDEKVYTKVWPYDTLKAIDLDTGKIKWTYHFYKAGIGYFNTENSFLYAPNGTVYAYFEWGNVLFSIHASGKENWMIQLPEQGKMHLMKDGTLLHIVSTSSKAGEETSTVYGYNKEGKQIFKKLIKGTVAKVSDTLIIVENHSASYTDFKADIYNSSMNRVFRYSFPQGSYTDLSYSLLLSNGNIIFRANLNKTGNRLIALSSKGKVLWGRDIPGNSEIVAAGDNYMVYLNKTVSLYNTKGLVAKRTFSNLNTEIQIYPLAEITGDDNILLNLRTAQYVLDQKKLSVLQEFVLNDTDAEIIYYNDNTVFSHFEKANKIAKYELK